MSSTTPPPKKQTPPKPKPNILWCMVSTAYSEQPDQGPLVVTISTFLSNFIHFQLFMATMS